MRRLYASGSLTLGLVIPCHNNPRQLYCVLTSLLHQTVPPENIIVVDDNSDSWHEEKLRSLCRRFRAVYRKLSAPRNRVEALGRRSHARNVGTLCLNTDVVLYVDGDILLSPGYVEEIKFYHRALPEVYIRGQRFSIPRKYQASGIEVCLNAISERQASEMPASVEYVTCPDDFVWQNAYQEACLDQWEWCASNNLSVRREYVARIGYWDENFYGWGEEDIDFSFRLHQLGLTPIVIISSAAAAYHLDHDIDHQLNALTLRRNAKYLLAKSPQVAPYREEAYRRHHIDIQ